MFHFSLRFLLFPCLLTSGLSAAVLPPGGTVLNEGSSLSATVASAVGKAEAIGAEGQQITVEKAVPDKVYTAQFTAVCRLPISKGEPVLAMIRARTVDGANQGGLVAKLQINAAPYTALAPTVEVSVPHAWTDLPVTFVSTLDETVDNAVVQLQCGHKQQTLEVQSVRIYRYATGTDTAGFPRIHRTYPGREPEAAWRKAALERIEKHRKADLGLQIMGTDGKPLRHAEVQVELRRHQFGFGTAVTAQHLTENSADDRRYQELVDRLFSTVVFENDLKDGNWEPQFDAGRKSTRNQQLNAAFGWLAQRNITIRGHYLMQVPTPYNFNGITDNQVIRDRVLASVTERLEFVKDRVYEWDVINHPIAWNGADMLNKRPGLEHLDQEVFRLARAKTALPFFVNEDQVFRPGPQHDETFAYIRALQDKGLTIAGLGNQAHFSDSYLPSPEHLLRVSDHFAGIVPHQSITEFDIVTTEDEDLAADFTRDALIAVFSHPAYTSFLFWGFWEGSHWKPEAASWNRDWTVRKRGEVLEKWLGQIWHTRLTLKTDADGRVQWRGFPGWYEISHQGSLTKAQVTKQQPQGVAAF